jgi:hypothetical protein
VWPKRAAASIVCAALVIAAAGAPWLGTPLRRLVNTEADGRDPPYDVPLDVQSLRRAAEQVPDDATYWIDAEGETPLVRGNLIAATHLLLTPAVHVLDPSRAQWVISLDGMQVLATPR